MENITDLFEQILKNNRAVDLAEAEFKRMIADDDELHEQYREWCDETGHTERRGFLDFAEEYIADQNEVWDTLNDEYDN
ncbi:MAG: hypothetical protein E7082_06055 [Bacteroidales bacterium]|nr:hypothetical protein [Bacteroidales bacterium]